jgi:hypothetical protein
MAWSRPITYMLDAVFIGLTFGAFMAFVLYTVGCEKL